jgi:hypothetical protein
MENWGWTVKMVNLKFFPPPDAKRLPGKAG